jgi:hypothetical protein
MKKFVLAGVLVLAAAMSLATTAAAETTRNFTVFNESRYRIDHVYVSPSNYTNWGFDRLGKDVLAPDYRFDLAVLPGWYDVKLIDQDGDSCVINGVDFRQGESWTITDGLLVACELFSGN